MSCPDKPTTDWVNAFLSGSTSADAQKLPPEKHPKTDLDADAIAALPCSEQHKVPCNETEIERKRRELNELAKQRADECKALYKEFQCRARKIGCSGMSCRMGSIRGCTKKSGGKKGKKKTTACSASKSSKKGKK